MSNVASPITLIYLYNNLILNFYKVSIKCLFSLVCYVSIEDIGYIV